MTNREGESMEKLKNQFTINLNETDAQALRTLAQLTQRKPAELLRLLVLPKLYEALKQANQEHNESNPTPGAFLPLWWDKLPKM